MDNLTNPALLFFVLGLIASQIKSDLKIPESSSKFISIYLLLSIGFKGGQELSHSVINQEVVFSMIFALLAASLVPIWSFFILRSKLNVENSGAIAAAYGSVSAVTFVTAISFLQFSKIEYSGYMVAVMALMEAPAIIVGILLINYFNKKKQTEKKKASLGKVIHHSLTNGSVLIIIGSLVIGFLANEKQAEGIKPFTTDIFNGFLAVFLLDMGLNSGKHIKSLFRKGIVPFAFATIMPFVNGLLALFFVSIVTDSTGNIVLFSILVASASYIAVPAAMKNAVPKANPGLYLPMALGITFPINIVIGIPFYTFITETYIK